MLSTIPNFYNPSKVEEIYRVPYVQRAEEAIGWAKKYDIKPAASDRKKICLMIIDAQNTFCLPDFELFVGGASGRGAIEDNDRLCRFIYENLDVITEIDPTMDTHYAMQIFHPPFWVNDAGDHPAPNTEISVNDVRQGIWKVDPSVASMVGGNYQALQRYALHYVETLSAGGKYQLYIWPYHAMLGGIGHALVSAVHEAEFFHGITRKSHTGFQIKGGNPLTENYSVLAPEVSTYSDGTAFAQKNVSFIKKLLEFDMVIIAGQAKSHCVAWTIADLLGEIKKKDPTLAAKVYILEDCTSPVVIPNVVDFTQQANDTFAEFKREGMHLVVSTDPISDWPNSPIK
ncbi:MAG: isochorismatase [Candidatus Shapirobacteria bacterium]|nr:isochorismatase [Candidatus Shapirobacteria bacterium]